MSTSLSTEVIDLASSGDEAYNERWWSKQRPRKEERYAVASFELGNRERKEVSKKPAGYYNASDDS